MSTIQDLAIDVEEPPRIIVAPDVNKIIVQNSVVSPLGGVKIAGVLQKSVGVVDKVRSMERFSLAYVLEGTGSYVGASGVRQSVGPGTAILLCPNQAHWYAPDAGHTWSEIFFEFQGPVFDLWQKIGCIDRKTPIIELRPIAYWKDRILQTIGANNEGNPVKMMEETIRVQNLLSEILNASRVGFEDEIAWVQRAQDSLMRSHDVREAARELSLSYESFRKRFRKHVGMPPAKYKTAVIMKTACQMLSEHDATIREIAAQLNYCDEYHFSKQFKQTIGWSPSEYRARLRIH